MINTDTQIYSMLTTLKRCYIERDKQNIGLLSNLLFNENHQPIIIGTSNDEWCFGMEECEQLFLSDWEDWGNVSIDVDNMVYENCGDYTWFYVPASVEYCFENNDDTYSAFMDMTLDVAGSLKKPIAKAGEILWLLTHLLHDRIPGERKYAWDMTISGILKNEESSLKIKSMQFSIPVLSAYPDVRTDTSKDDAHYYMEECRKIQNYILKQKTACDDALAEQLSRLFDNDKHISYVSDEKKRYIGCDGIQRSSTELLDYFSCLRDKGIMAMLQQEQIIAIKSKKAFLFYGVGLIKRDIYLDSELNNIFASMERYKIMENKKDALFNIRRDLALTLKEATLSNKSQEPIRVEGVGRISDKKDLIIEYMQISYPFNHVLEQKTDAAKIV